MPAIQLPRDDHHPAHEGMRAAGEVVNDWIAGTRAARLRRVTEPHERTTLHEYEFARSQDCDFFQVWLRLVGLVKRLASLSWRAAFHVKDPPDYLPHFGWQSAVRANQP